MSTNPAYQAMASARVLAACLATVLLASCSESATPKPPNLLLITLDTLRQDHCSVYGYDLPTTPNLESFARTGLRFDQAFAPMATTGPTHASLFTGLYPVAHRIVKNGLFLDDEHDTLAEQLQAEGWRTAGITSSFVLDERFGYSQGFQAWQDEFTQRGSSTHMPDWEGHKVTGGFDRRADAATRRAVRWLERHAVPGNDTSRGDDAQPFFLFVHYFDPHNPYDPPPEFDAQYAPRGPSPLQDAIARYDAEIAFTDQQVGALLDSLRRLGLDDNTLVVITGDHGEELMEHGHMEHGVHVYDETVHVPLLARWPGRLPAGRVVAEPVEVVDLAPTLLSLLGAPALGRAQGRDLASGWLGQTGFDADHPVFLHRRHYEPGMEGTIPVAGEKLAVRLGGWKYIVGDAEGTRELYDLTADPDERYNLEAERPEQAAKLAARLAAWLQSTARQADASGQLSEEDLLRLEALGYTK